MEMISKISIIIGDLSGGGAVRAFLVGQVLHKLGYATEVNGFLFGQEIYADPPKGISIVSNLGCSYPKFLWNSWKALNNLDGSIIYAIKAKPSSFGLSLIRRIKTKQPVILDMDDWEMSWYGGDQWQYRATPKQVARDLLKREGQLRNPDHPLYVKWLEKKIPWADAITVDTQFLQNRFGGVYLPNGKDTDLFDPKLYDPEASRRKYGLSQYRVLMFPGAPRPHKGVEDILTALEQLNEEDLRLVIVGGSPYDDYDDRLLERWGKWIVKLPRCPVETMPEVLSAAHVIVVPQKDTLTAKAQFPLKLTDGMAMAKPVLSTRVGDIPEIMGNTGYLADPDSPHQLAQQIQAIFQDVNLATDKGEAARARCVKYYSLETMAATLSEVISNLNHKSSC